ncbi:beta-phosphoglucomutase [Mycoplasma sp. 6243]|uniref:beta-phosphoglucomutase n=1 Tax=Mycoplasma sp. 6243 TaxID=3440865 RepID=UPI003EBA8C69
MIKGIIFDLDGVITDTAILHYQSWAKVIKQFDIDYTFADNELLRGLPRIETLKAILKLKKPSLQLNNSKLLEVSEQKNLFYKELLQTQINEKSILPGITKFLSDAKNKNLKLAIASSSYNAPTILEKLGIINLFDYIVYPGDIKNGKPAPDIFIKAAAGLSLDVSECFGIEDAVAGIQGIKDAKMKAVAITANTEEFKNADIVLTSTSQLNLDTILAKFN